MLSSKKRLRILLWSFLFAIVLLPAIGASVVGVSIKQETTKQGLTPVQLEIEKQRQVLSSADVEDRRQALVRLRELRHPQASRVALGSLSDPSPAVRATATASVLSLPPEESAAGLIPLLSDKEEFVRQQTAYALGQTGSRSAVAPLIERLSDKQDSVRGAAAVALGEIADATAVTYLSMVLNRQGGLPTPKKGKKTKLEQNPFVLRAAAHSLGQIGNRAALPALLLALQAETMEDDVRREAAWALGRIGDVSAIPALRQALTARDPYLAEIAQEALRNISKVQNGGRM
jgi:HEAT repeat protein